MSPISTESFCEYSDLSPASWFTIYLKEGARNSLHTSPIIESPSNLTAHAQDADLISNEASVSPDALLMSRMQIEQSWGILTFCSVLKLHINAIRKMKPSRDC